MRVEVHVTLKPDVLDPQGDAVLRALQSHGFSDLRRVRVGKLIELELDRDDPELARTEVRAMCEGLLRNPVIEDFRVICPDEMGEAQR